MTRLILVRHAKSDWGDPELEDFDRPLNKRGRHDAPRIGAWLTGRGHRAEAGLISSANRAVQTFARLHHGATPPPARFLDTLYLAEPDAMLTALRAAPAAVVMMIGHNPGIGTFARRLLRAGPLDEAFKQYPTCATTVVEFDTPWTEVDWRSGSLVDFMIPKRLK